MIPKAARDTLGLKPGARLHLRIEDGRQIDHDPLSMESALEAARIMRRYARNKGPRERVAPDFLIGAHALVQADALQTTDAGFFRHYFEGLNVVSP